MSWVKQQGSLLVERHVTEVVWHLWLATVLYSAYRFVSWDLLGWNFYYLFVGFQDDPSFFFEHFCYLCVKE